jgi:hypothetical protein
MFGRSLFVHLSFFFWPLCCLSFDYRFRLPPFDILKLFLLKQTFKCLEYFKHYLLHVLWNEAIWETPLASSNNIRRNCICYICGSFYFDVWYSWKFAHLQLPLKSNHSLTHSPPYCIGNNELHGSNFMNRRLVKWARDIHISEDDFYFP